MKKIDDRYSYYPKSIDLLNKLEKDKNYSRENSLTCATPHLTREIKAYSNYETSEVWGTSIYFKKILSSDDKDILMEFKDEAMKEDKGIIVDLIKAAHTNAKIQLKTKTTDEITKATGGFGIPGFKWPL